MDAVVDIIDDEDALLHGDHLGVAKEDPEDHP
jgi:hypothetical protein